MNARTRMTTSQYILYAHIPELGKRTHVWVKPVMARSIVWNSHVPSLVWLGALPWRKARRPLALVYIWKGHLPDKVTRAYKAIAI